MALTKIQQGMSDTLVSGTAVTASGTSVDFTGIPAGVKRITVMFSGVSTNGTSNFLIQLGDSGGIETSGYLSAVARIDSAFSAAYANSTAGFICSAIAAIADTQNGAIVIATLGANSWSCQGNVFRSGVVGAASMSSGSKTLSGTLDRVRITTVNGTDVFDAGTINIMYE